MKISTILFVLGGTVLALDTFAQATTSTPTGIDSVVGKIRSFYAPIDDMIPGPLGLWIIATGAGVRWGLGK